MQIINSIQNRIYELRGELVMLDFDLAALYETETRTLNQAVKRNIKRFSKGFMFQLTAEEWNNLRSQFVTSSSNNNRISSQIVMTSTGKRPNQQRLTSSPNKAWPCSAEF